MCAKVKGSDYDVLCVVKQVILNVCVKKRLKHGKMYRENTGISTDMLFQDAT